MNLIERYLLRQLVGPTLLAIAALAGLIMLSTVLGNLDVIGEGQSPLILIKISLLAMPQLISLVLPVALFVAALIVLNRLHTEQEIVVCFASGMSIWKVIAPAMRTATVFTLIALFLNLWLAPLADRALRNEMFRIRTDLAASMIHVGQFNSPSAGITVYAQDLDQGGAFHNVFLLQEEEGGGDTTFIANRGKMAKRNGQPVLVLRDGSNQEFSKAGVLNYLKFDEYTVDLAPYLAADEIVQYKIADRYLHELIFPDLTQQWERKNRRALLAEAHGRLSAPLYNIAFVAMALAAVIGGPFSRLGYIPRIMAVSASAAGARLLGIGVLAASTGSVWVNVLQYLIPAMCALWAFGELFRWPINRRLARFGRAAPRAIMAGAPA
jgi:lipopolysaccharide export system permease protein